MISDLTFSDPHSAFHLTRGARRLLVVTVTMMDVGIVRVIVGLFSMVMDVRMWFAGRIGWLVHVLMMLVMPVEMLMRHCFMAVRVDVALGKMEPYADQHEAARSPEKQRRLLV